jgi:hypothetical protein
VQVILEAARTTNAPAAISGLVMPSPAIHRRDATAEVRITYAADDQN